jgi:hypothetical protein
MNSQLKYNPFKPNGIIAPGAFVGRIDEIKVIERCLFQAKNGNPQHFLIQGERGIGKSSLLFYIEMMVNGHTGPLIGGEFSFVSISIDLGGCTTQIDIVRKIGRDLKSKLSEMDSIKSSAKSLLNWLANWEVLGVRYHKDQSSLDPEEISEQLVEFLANLSLSTAGQIDGIMLLIDEADRPPAEAGLGEFLKVLTERLTKRGCNNLIVGLAALPSILGKLRDSHESAPRLFHTMLLEPLAMDERKRVVNISLAAANKKNEQETSISFDALEALADLSEGYPHFLQQFSYCAFEKDSDDIIDVDDVRSGAFDEGGALAQLGDKFFNDMYHARISSEEYRRVLDAMANHGDQWTTRKDIIKESGVSESNVNNAFSALKSKQIILQDDTRRGVYRLPTKSFAAWINAMRSAQE